MYLGCTASASWIHCQCILEALTVHAVHSGFTINNDVIGIISYCICRGITCILDTLSMHLGCTAIASWIHCLCILHAQPVHAVHSGFTIDNDVIGTASAEVSRASGHVLPVHLGYTASASWKH